MAAILSRRRRVNITPTLILMVSMRAHVTCMLIHQICPLIHISERAHATNQSPYKLQQNIEHRFFRLMECVGFVVAMVEMLLEWSVKPISSISKHRKWGNWVESCTGVTLYRGVTTCTLRWCHNGRDSVSNHQPHDCLLDCLFRRRSKKTSKLRVTGLCVGN